MRNKDRSAGQVVHLRVLGSFQVRDTAAKLIPILSKKNKALLTILLLAPGYAATRERLSAILWGDKDESQARSSLRQSLAVLRKELGPESPILVAHQDIISLDMRRLRADVVDFLAAASSSASADQEHAAALYGGELLEDLTLREGAFEDWLALERRSLADRLVSVLERLAAGGAPDGRVATAKRLVELDPLRESSHRILMQAYRAGGDHSLAIRHYAHCRDLLMAELGIEPSPATQELFHACRSEACQNSAKRPVSVQPDKAEELQDETRLRTH